MPGSQCSQYKTLGRNGPCKVPTIRVFFRVSRGDAHSLLGTFPWEQGGFCSVLFHLISLTKSGRGPSRPEGGGKLAPRVPFLA